MIRYKYLNLFTIFFSRIIPKKKDRWVFGAWFGKNYSDNTKAFLEYMVNNYPDIEKIWLVDNPSLYSVNGCKFVKRKSFRAFIYVITSKVAIMNQGYSDFYGVNLLGGCYKVQLWHGIAWKKISKDSFEYLSSFDSMLYDLINKYDLYISPSNKYTKVLQSAFNAKESNIICCGQPRNSVFFDSNYVQRAHEYILNKCGVKNKKIILYMPTFRDNTDKVYSLSTMLNDQKFYRMIENSNYIFVQKMHFKNKGIKNKEEYEDIIFDLPEEDAQILLASADILVTDYSSCFFDYLILDRPIIHFVYDYEYYKTKDRGLYYSIEEVAAGQIAYNEHDLRKAIINYINTPELDKNVRKTIRDLYINNEGRDSSKFIAERIMKDIYR